MTVSTELPSEAPQNPQGKRDLKSILIPVILVILGLAVLVYPVVATQWNNIRQVGIANEYAKLEKNADPVQLDKQLEDARKYNERQSTGPILDPWLEKVAINSTDYADYLKQLGQFDTMGRLIVPSGDINLPIYHGTEHETLQKGVGHLFGSDLPVGGQDSHSVLTGHTGLPNATLFDNLKNVKEGDAIYVQVSGEKLKYQVSQIKIVLPNESDDLRPQTGKDLITLVTCTPYGINSHRLLVTGHRVDMDEADVKAMEDAKGTTWQWWMWAILAAAVVVLIAMLAWLIRQLRKNNSNDEDEDTEEYPKRISARELIRKYQEEQGYYE